MSTESLWGNLDKIKKRRTPTSIIREQAEILNKATKGVLRGLVTKENISNKIFIKLFIMAPYLNKYKYELLRVEHGSLIYPVIVLDPNDDKDIWTECKKEDQFLTVIKNILSSDKTKDVIESLISQSES